MSVAKAIRNILPPNVVELITKYLIPPYGAIIDPHCTVNWYDDGWFMRDISQIYDAFVQGFVTVVTVCPVLEVSWRSNDYVGSYLVMMEDASFDELIEGFPHDRIVLDYTRLFVGRD